MRLFIEIPVGQGPAGSGEIEVLPEHTVGEVKQQVCVQFGIPQPENYALMYAGQVLHDSSGIGSTGVTENARLALLPWDIIAGSIFA